MFKVICVLVLSTIVLTTSINAKTAALTGRVTELGTTNPVPGVSVRVTLLSDTTYKRIIYTNLHGYYHFKNIASGNVRVDFYSLGYRKQSTTITLTDGRTDTINIELTTEPLRSDEVIISASRYEEKVTKAPAAITVLDARQARQERASTPVDFLYAVPGLDVNQEGIAQFSYASRGFTSVYTGSMYTLTDYRSNALPSVGGNFGLLMPVSPEDVDHIEIIRGPGAAIYGPSAAEGVVHIFTSTPFASQGTTLSATGGERQYMNFEMRHAQSASDNWAFKVSTKYIKAKDWEYLDTIETNARSAAFKASGITSAEDSIRFFDTVRIAKRDPMTEIYSVEGRLDGYITDNIALILSGGISNAVNAIQLTELAGAAQIRDANVVYGQARLTINDLFLQGYYQQLNNSGTYFLRTGQGLIDHSGTYTLQAQHQWRPVSEERLVYGIDFTSTSPNNFGLYGVHSQNVTSNIIGGYLQSETKLVENTLDLVLAGRVDKRSERSDLYFSPRAALVYVPVDNHTLRLMYNNSSRLESILSLYYDVNAYPNIFGLPPANAINLRVAGSQTRGSHFEKDASDSYYMYSSFSPTPNTPIASSNGVSGLWPVLQAIAGQYGVDLSKIAAPSSDMVSTYMAVLDPTTASFNPVAAPVEIPDYKPLRNTVIELDYQYKVSKDLEIELDLFHSQYKNFPAIERVLTPNVFANPTQLGGYIFAGLLAEGMDTATAEATSAAATQILAAVPLGTVSPAGSRHPTDLLYASGGVYGDIDYYGLDFSTTMSLTPELTLRAGASWVSDNYWDPKEDGDSVNPPISTNIPKYKSHLSLRYDGLVAGLGMELRHRWYDSFRQTGFYMGSVNARNIVDLLVNYTIPSMQSLKFTLTVTNLLDNKRQDFLGAPAIGRLATLRAVYTLPQL